MNLHLKLFFIFVYLLFRIKRHFRMYTQRSYFLEPKTEYKIGRITFRKINLADFSSGELFKEKNSF